MVYFMHTSAKITPEDSTKRISSVTVKLFFYDCTGTLYVTDLLLQGGGVEEKKGFYQYSAAWDSKYKVTLEEGKLARVLFEIRGCFLLISLERLKCSYCGRCNQ